MINEVAPMVKVEWHSGKAQVYSFLASLFSSKPTEDHILKLKIVSEILGLKVLRNYTAEELHSEYMELFGFPNPRYLAPFESVYRDKLRVAFPADPEQGLPPRVKEVRGLLWGDSTVEVKKCYEQAGLSPEQGIPDHIANELAFVAYLLEQEQKVGKAKKARLREPRKRFIQEHLAKWVGLLEQRILEVERLGFYGNAISATRLIVESELD